MSLWEEFCIQVVKNVLPLIPSLVNDGFHDFGLDIPPSKNIALPDLTGFDTSATLEGFCGIGVKDLGTAVLDLTGSRLNGLDTIAPAPGQAITFATPEVVMLIPLVIGKLTIDSQLEVRHRCKPADSAEYTGKAKGTTVEMIESAKVTMTISGLDPNKGRAGAVLLAWSSPAEPPKLTFGSITFTPDTKKSASLLVNNYLKVGHKEIEGTLIDQLAGILSGAISLGSRTLPGTLLEVINGAFSKVG